MFDAGRRSGVLFKARRRTVELPLLRLPAVFSVRPRDCHFFVNSGAELQPPALRRIQASKGLIMKTLLAASVAFLALGSFALAQTYAQGCDTTSPPTVMNGTATDDTLLTQKTSDNGTAAQKDTSDAEFNRQEFQGTELQRAYQEEPRTGWQDPNLVKSGNIGGGGSGGSGGM